MIADERPLGELIATLAAGEVSAAEQAGLDELASTMPAGEMRELVAFLAQSLRDGHDLALFAREPAPEWDGFESQLDLLAATVYNARAQSPREMTPERWARVKRNFRAPARSCLEQAQAELDDM